MARGDVISVNHSTIGNGATIDIRPASGVEWNIRFMTASGRYARLHTNSGTYELKCGLEAGGTTPSNDADESFVVMHASRIDLYVNNSQSVRFYGTVGNNYVSYLGVATK